MKVLRITRWQDDNSHLGKCKDCRGADENICLWIRKFGYECLKRIGAF